MTTPLPGELPAAFQLRAPRLRSHIRAKPRRSGTLKPLAASIGSSIILPCDVEDDGQLDEAFGTLGSKWGGLDFLVHAIAHSDKNELKGRYVDTSRANFVRSLSISCYSFTAAAQRASALDDTPPSKGGRGGSDDHAHLLLGSERASRRTTT